VRKLVGILLFVTMLGGAFVLSQRLAPGAHARAPDADARARGERLLTMQDAEQARASAARLAEASRHGDYDAAVALGRLYSNGTPLFPRDAARALPYFRQAAAAHHAAALYFLGVMTQRGEGVPADAAQAAQLFAAAAAAGSAQAMFLLGNAYRSGNGVPHDERRALELYQRAGEHGNAAALQTLAMAYRYGELGLEADESAAGHYQAEAEHSLHEPAAP
jgi:TPR repeat protein